MVQLRLAAALAVLVAALAVTVAAARKPKPKVPVDGIYALKGARKYGPNEPGPALLVRRHRFAGAYTGWVKVRWTDAKTGEATVERFSLQLFGRTPVQYLKNFSKSLVREPSLKMKRRFRTGIILGSRQHYVTAEGTFKATLAARRSPATKKVKAVVSISFSKLDEIRRGEVISRGVLVEPYTRTLWAPGYSAVWAGAFGR